MYIISITQRFLQKVNTPINRTSSLFEPNEIEKQEIQRERKKKMFPMHRDRPKETHWTSILRLAARCCFCGFVCAAFCSPMRQFIITMAIIIVIIIVSGRNGLWCNIMQIIWLLLLLFYVFLLESLLCLRNNAVPIERFCIFCFNRRQVSFHFPFFTKEF